jgi:uncharacterized membrane protein YgcG
MKVDFSTVLKIIHFRWLIIPSDGSRISRGLIDEPKGYFSYVDKIPLMKYYTVLLFVIVFASLVLAGCTQPSGTVPVTPAAAITTVSTPEPGTPVITTTATSAPRQVVTIVHQVSLTKDLKDSELLFTLQVPVEWNVATYREKTTDPEVMIYKTDLVADNVFSIRTYTVSRSQDQAYRDEFRKWEPAPVETTVTINSIIYDRFESTSNGKTSVGYVARKGSVNERGYASVIVFTADTSDRFEKEDFEKIVASFRYFSGSSAGTMPGTEIPRISIPFESSGSAQSARSSGDSGSSGGSSSGGCSRCSVS